MGLLFSSCTKEVNVSPNPPTVYAIPQVDNAVNSFMGKYNIPGLSVVITKGEKLVYAKGSEYTLTTPAEWLV